MAAIIEPLKSHPAKIRMENFSGKRPKIKALNIQSRSFFIFINRGMNPATPHFHFRSNVANVLHPF
jgi:hypothetical protein